MRIAVALVALLLASAPAAAADKDENENRGGVLFKLETSLEDGVNQFNARIKSLGAGKGQPPLTPDEVVAAIRGWIPEQHPVEPHILRIFQDIAETGKLPPGSSIDFCPSWVGYNGFHFDVWWVDLSIGPIDRTQKDPVIGYGYTYRIRDQKIRSRPMTEDEKKAGEGAGLLINQLSEETTVEADQPNVSAQRAASKPSDEPSELGMAIIRIRNADAESLILTVQRLFHGSSDPRLVTVFDKRTNTIIARGPKTELKVLEDLLHQLDQLPDAKKPE